MMILVLAAISFMLTVSLGSNITAEPQNVPPEALLPDISPCTQMHAGVDAANIECREGFSLVMKASNGVDMCLKADTALKMIDRGLVVPTS